MIGNEEDTGPKLWFNEIVVTKSIAKREFQKHNYETALEYCDRILAVSNDLETLLLRTKCQQRLLQPKLANETHLLAESEAPNSSFVVKNRASLLLDDGEFEKSLITYLNAARKRKRPPVFALGALKASQILNDLMILRKNKYRRACLGNTVIELANRGDLENLTDADELLSKYNLTRKRNGLYYLGRVGQDKKYFEEVYKSRVPKCPFYDSDKKIQNNMRTVLKAIKVAEEQLYKRKQMYIVKCETHHMRGDRLLVEKSQRKAKKDMRDLQIAKYLNTIIQLIINNKIKEAKQQIELITQFMKKTNYDSSIILDIIFRSVGVSQFLLFQDKNGWSDEHNHERMLILLGASNNLNNITLQESIFGPYDSNPKVTNTKLWARLRKSNSVIEKLYLNYEIAKCYIQMGSDNLIDAGNKTSECLELARAVNSPTWAANSVILNAIVEFQSEKKNKCSNSLIRAIEISQTLEVPGVIEFLKKIKEIIHKVDYVDASPNEKRQLEIVNFMPDIIKKMDTMYIFRRLNTMPVNRQMSLVPGVLLKYNQSKYTPEQAAHKYLTLVPGSQTQRLGIPEFKMQKRIKLNVEI